MRPRKEDTEFVQKLKESGIPRTEVIDIIHGTYLREMDERKVVRQRRIAALSKVYES